MRLTLTALFLALVVTLPIQRAIAAEPPSKPARLTREQVEFAATLMAGAKANNTFTWALWPKMIDAKAPKNVLYSAPSLSQSLAMAAAGAAGPTRNEIWTALGFKPQGDPLAVYAGLLQAFQKSQMPKTQFTTANALWVSHDTPLKPEYIKGMETLLAAKAQNVDFSRLDQVVTAVNDWVKTNTKGKIPTLISRDQINSLTRVILTNAVYFKADWENGFGLVLNNQRFRVNADQVETVAMLYSSRVCNYAEDDEYQMIELPYLGGKTLFRVILPATNPKQKTPVLLSSPSVDKLLARARQTQVNITLPKFKLEHEQDMIPALKALKVKQAFEKGDFSPMLLNPAPEIYISDVIHKSVIQVDESGTVAAAATSSYGTIFGPGSSPTPRDTSMNFIADHPFNFQIVDRETNSILFMGFLANPGPERAPEPTPAR